MNASLIRRLALLSLVAASIAVPAIHAESPAPTTQATAPAGDLTVRYKFVEVDGVRVFYREAGNPKAPAILLLHGFPTSSHMFRNLIPLLAKNHRVIAPDLPGFGQTVVPPERNYTYTFDALSRTTEAFTDAVGLKKYALYVFDYGAPTGYRLALRRPQNITAIISQNGNAYAEGLSPAWSPIQAYWRDPTPANRDALRGFLAAQTTRWQYTEGVRDTSLIAPEAYLLDQLNLDRPGAADIQLDLFKDYKTNVDLYPKFQEYFRTSKTPILAVWGKNDPFFLPAGAQAYQRDNPTAQVHLYDTGHFALETHSSEIAAQILLFLSKINY